MISQRGFVLTVLCILLVTATCFMVSEIPTKRCSRGHYFPYAVYSDGLGHYKGSDALGFLLKDTHDLPRAALGDVIEEITKDKLHETETSKSEPALPEKWQLADPLDFSQPNHP